ncbi:MAG: patatin-like phospholipase family protein [Deltaproteobacteria bacterium]|nr:patatin-like phospholipase family protein [Deltaproteobacteria bacterium]MBW2532402.1 patatin-like phospholipase family protein [Deltaproteobacteria bacterium]
MTKPQVEPLAPLCRQRACDPCGHGVRRLLYVNAAAAADVSLFDDIVHSGRCERDDDCVRPQLRCGSERLCWVAEDDPCVAVERLRELYFNAVLLDFRWSPEVADTFDQRIDQALCLLDRLDQAEDLEARYGFHRIVVLVSGPDPERIDRFIADLGGRGVGRVLRERWPGGVYARRDAASAASFAAAVYDELYRMMSDRPTGSTALCAAGGGITGIFFELGALKCIDDCFRRSSLNELDMYFGISAGAVVTGLLAAGYSIDEVMAGVAGVEGGRIGPLNLSLLRWKHVDRSGLLTRMVRTVRSAGARLSRVLRRQQAMELDGWMLDYSDVLGPPFHAGQFESDLAELLTRPGVTNDFRELRRRLFIGASDQDLRQHVLFGDEGWNHVPISKAVAASLAINPAFASVEIDGRYYEDGAVTRTSNFSEAIRRGASLIFVIDPFVPYVSRKPGFAAQRGLLYNVDQDLRTVSFTRFENTRNWVLRKYPQVSSYTFLPSNRMRRLMSINPMDHRPFLEIWRGAYLATFNRLKRIHHRWSGDLRAHGIVVDLDRTTAVAERLRATRNPSLADFFPDGRIALRQPARPISTFPPAAEAARLGAAS